jgi:hypothetical protein
MHRHMKDTTLHHKKMIAKLLFDASMSIIEKQNSQGVGLFTAGNMSWVK